MVRVPKALKDQKEGITEMKLPKFIEFVLEKVDTDKDGIISQDELCDAIRGHGGWFASWKAKRGVKSADVNLNGVIDKDEIPNLAAFAEKYFNVRLVAY